MRVIFLQHVINVWKVWEVKEVATGYARNFLFPKKLAREFSPEDERKQKDKQKKIEQEKLYMKLNRNELFEKINGKEFEFILEKSQWGKTYGSVGEKDIMEKLKKDMGLTLSKSDIEFSDGHIKKIGKHNVFINLWGWVSAKIIVKVWEK